MSRPVFWTCREGKTRGPAKSYQREPQTQQAPIPLSSQTKYCRISRLTRSIPNADIDKKIANVIISIMTLKSLFFAAFMVLSGLSNARATGPEKLIGLARASIEAEVRGQALPGFESKERARPVFVTIERSGQVIGCRGSLRARTNSLGAEVVLAARSAASTDPRYPPLTPAQLDNFRVTVTVVEAQIPLDASAISSLRREDGLVLQAGNRTGIVLPWEGSNPNVRLGWAYKKAGVARGAKCRLFRLKAMRFAG